MKVYKIKRKLKNLQKREREGTRNIFFLLLGLSSTSVEVEVDKIFFPGVLDTRIKRT